MIQPFSSMKPQGIKDTTECPVREHTDPDRNRSETKNTTKTTHNVTLQSHMVVQDNIMENSHRRRPHGICRNKSRYPYDWFDDGDPGHHKETHPTTLCAHTSQMDDWFCQCKHQQAADDDNYLRYQAHLFCIVYRLILSSGTDTLSYYIHQTDADTDAAIPFRFSRIFVFACARLPQYQESIP